MQTEVGSQKEAIEPYSDERYNVKYIEREAFLILNFASPHNKKNNAMRLFRMPLTPVDHRILTRWGLK